MVITLFASCSKHTSRSGSNTIEYVAGSISYNDSVPGGGITIRNYPAIWVDRVLTVLSTTFEGYAAKIIRVGSDVYVGGKLRINNIGYGEAVIWKNGQVIRLSPGNYGYVCDILIDGSDIYAVGYRSGKGATMWKNGNEIYLPSSSSTTITGEAVSISKLENGDIIVGGFDYVINQDAFPVIWKNGIPSRISEPNYVTQDIYAFQGNVYTLTRNEIGANSINFSVWKNNSKVASFSDYYFNSIYIDSSEIMYLAGMQLNSPYLASYLRGNTRYSFGFIGESHGIALSNSSIYVCGETNDIAGIQGDKPFVWSNNQVFYLPVPSSSSSTVEGSASDIFFFEE
jgi:hypothetical protein